MTMTPEEQKMFEQFAAHAKKQLKTMSKNDLVKTCVALLVDNYGLKGALEQFKAEQEAAKAEDKPAQDAP